MKRVSIFVIVVTLHLAFMMYLMLSQHSTQGIKATASPILVSLIQRDTAEDQDQKTIVQKQHNQPNITIRKTTALTKKGIAPTVQPLNKIIEKPKVEPSTINQATKSMNQIVNAPSAAESVTKYDETIDDQHKNLQTERLIQNDARKDNRDVTKVVSIEPPQFGVAYLNNPAPNYPRLSIRAKEEGRVLLRVLVTESGAPEEVILEDSSGFEGLDLAAIEAVKQWQFVPAKLNHNPTSAYVLVPVKFSLN